MGQLALPPTLGLEQSMESNRDTDTRDNRVEPALVAHEMVAKARIIRRVRQQLESGDIPPVPPEVRVPRKPARRFRRKSSPDRPGGFAAGTIPWESVDRKY